MNNIGHYRIIRKLGAGGMGSVYLAQDDRLDRTVAVKVLQAELLNSSAARLRFEREAKSIARLAHPNITVVYEIGEHDEAPFLVMEFVEGQSLSERTALGPLPHSDFLKYAEQIAEALQHAHERGVVHGDIKASNVMITAANQAKLLGCAMALAPKDRFANALELAALFRSANEPVREWEDHHRRCGIANFHAIVAASRDLPRLDFSFDTKQMGTTSAH